MYDQCGLLISSPCVDGAGVVIPERDRYMCGDDQLIPSVAYKPKALGEYTNTWNEAERKSARELAREGR